MPRDLWLSDNGFIMNSIDIENLNFTGYSDDNKI